MMLIERDYVSPADIPPHSRWRHFEAGPKGPMGATKIDRIGPLMQQWDKQNVDQREKIKRLLDLFVVGVLLDAGAGSVWKYQPKGEQITYNRSEGLGIASFDLFASGALSSLPSNPFQCDSSGLAALTPDMLKQAFQVTLENELVGLEGRCCLLQKLGTVLEASPQFFKGPANDFRPGNLVDYLFLNATKSKLDHKTVVVHIDILWNLVIQGLSGVWPKTRTVLDDCYLGDVWPSKAMAAISKNDPDLLKEFPGSESFVCFHKLSQWLVYSLMEPLALAGIEFEGVGNMTGLAEYRNGGLFIDYDVIKLKKSISERFTELEIPRFQVWDDVIVEWRALTVVLLDKVADLVRKRLGMTEKQLPLAKILEAGTWKLGREIAAKLRPKTNGPPIEVISDGTVF